MADPVDLFDPRTLPAGDEGKTDMVIFVHQGTKKVIQRFARPMEFVAYDPQNLVPIAGQMLDCCQELGFTVSLKVPKRKITEQDRAVLITRVGHILRTHLERGAKPEAMSRNVVDTVLSYID